MGQKLGALLLFLWGEGLGPNVTQCDLGRGLLSYQVASLSIQPFGHNGHGLKIGGCAPFFGGVELHGFPSVAWTEAYIRAKFHLDPSKYRLATIHQRHRQQTGERSDSIGRTVLQTVAPKLQSTYPNMKLGWEQFETITKLLRPS